MIVLSFGPRAAAQDDDDAWYRLELGGGLGLGSMLDDTNDKAFGNNGFAASLIARFPLNPRMAIKTQLGFLNSKNDVSKVTNFYPAQPGIAGSEALKYNYSGSLLDLAVMYELHFLPYGYLPSYLGYSRIVPFIQMGLGTSYSTVSKAACVSIPLGVGIKYKLARRWNLGLDWRINFTTSDKLEGLEAPHGITTSGFKKKDHYNILQLSVTYDLSPKCPTCNRYR
jgi:hypothetical protein